MAKSAHQKLKILYLAKILTERTDEEHPMSAAALLTELGRFGISAERKSIYDDIEALRSFGMPIGNRRRRPSGFYLEQRDFSEGELRLIGDAIVAAPFISSAKSHTLLGKLARLTSASAKSRLTPAIQREKKTSARDEQIYESVDCVRDCMDKDCQVSFQYYQWTAEKKYVLKKNGERYRVSPWGVIWNDGWYYLIGIDEKSRIVKHYRIDKMQDLQRERGRRSGHDLFEHFDAPEFAARTFGMFGGREETVTVEFSNALIGVLIDRFGEDVRILPKDEQHCTALLRVTVSRQFYGWLAGLGTDAEIVSPLSARKEYQRFLKKALDVYTRDKRNNEQP